MKERGFIRTSSPTSKSRFELVLRKTAKWFKKHTSGDTKHATDDKSPCDGSHHKRQRNNKTSYQYKKRGRSRSPYKINNKSSYQSQKQPSPTPKAKPPVNAKAQQWIDKVIHHQAMKMVKMASPATGNAIKVPPLPDRPPVPHHVILKTCQSQEDWSNSMGREIYDEVLSYSKSFEGHKVSV
ncbi:MAG: hypothetical protein VYC12_04285 [Candidatus Thermoplasmatota archaeon]|nr:hypothetical protein [Candidatus Thermoplasmatota archaeon]